MIKNFTQPLLWVDLEMSGLNLKKDKILEFACVLTDAQLQNITLGPHLIIKTEKELLDGMDEWCTIQHGKSGLTNSCLKSNTLIQDCEQQILDFLIHNGIQSREALIAGNTVGTDKSFIDLNMPRLSQYLHYRIIDVSTIKELCRRWKPELLELAPQKSFSHRALDDINESIKELQFYQKNFFLI